MGGDSQLPLLPEEFRPVMGADTPWGGEGRGCVRVLGSPAP